MLTDNKEITLAEYWNRIYRGANDNAKVDASNTKRAARTFDRFDWVAKYAEGPNFLGVASGHAHIEKRVQAAHKDWYVVASDQAADAIPVSRFLPYWVIDVNGGLPLVSTYDKSTRCWNMHGKWNTIAIAQALEYLEDDRAFVSRAALVSYCLIATLPIGEMDKWSQLRIYTLESARKLFEEFGKIEVFEQQGDILLVKTRFNAS